MAVSDGLMRRYVRFYTNKTEALKAARSRKGVLIQEIRGRQWVVATGDKVIKESLKRGRESMAYLGKAPPKIIADFRVGK